MSKLRYLCRISILETAVGDASKKFIDVGHSDKKLFTIGSGPDADIRIQKSGIEALHISVSVETPHLFIKNISRANTLLGKYLVQFEKRAVYKSGETIQLGDSQQIIKVELFKKFMEPHEESEAIVRDAWDKAKASEALILEQKQLLTAQVKVAEDLKLETEKKIKELNEQTKVRSEEIHKSALQTKEQIIKTAEQEAQLAAQRAEKEALLKTQAAEKEAELRTQTAEKDSQRILNEVIKAAQDKARHTVEQAQKEADTLLNISRHEAESLIDIAKRQAKETSDASKRAFQELLNEKNKVQKEISDCESLRIHSMDKLTSTGNELKKLEESKLKMQQQNAQEKERLALAIQEHLKQKDLQEREKSAVKAEIDSFMSYFGEMKTKLEAEKTAAQKELARCAHEAKHANTVRDRAQSETEQHEINLKELRKKINSLQTECATINQRITAISGDEAAQREEMRRKLDKEYSTHKEFIKTWFVKQRAIEQDLMMKERSAKAKLESERLTEQAQKIAEKIQPLLSLELTTVFGEEQVLAFKPQLEKIVSPVVQRCIQEEYEFRRDNWENVQQQFSLGKGLAEKAQKVKRSFDITTFSLWVLMVASVGLGFGLWNYTSNVQARSISSQSAPNPLSPKEFALKTQ